MWRRVLLVLVIYSTIAVVGLAIPLAITLSRERLQRFSENRFSAAAYFADLAARQDDSHAVDLQQAVERYYGLYGEPVLVVGRDGTPRASAGVTGTRQNVADAVSEALRNQRSRIPESVTPWSPPEVLVAVPVGTGTQVDGAVVLAANTAVAKNDVTRAWLTIVAGATALLLVASLIAVALSRWTVRPLTDLAARVSALKNRVLEPSDAIPHDQDTDSSHYAGPQEVRRLSAAFDTMARDVEAAATAQRRFVADSAHALRNPLAALRIRLDTLGMAVPDSATAAHRKTTVEVERLEGIVADLLALASAETRHADPYPAADVGAVLTERHDFWSTSLADAGIAATVTTPDDLYAAIPDTDLTQILDTALSNAVKYARSGAHLALGARRDGEQIVIWVDDDGPGVSEEDLPLIATRFFRAANTVGQGTGLGLSIACALTERAGGGFRVSASDTGGLRIELRLPRADDPAAGGELSS
ncbi:HAMP domain-containing histidine kinase [Mycolicibacterium sp. 018/SC-01/001]|uniref:sensor histidine kinase n=1 Tax=Mycolicibacterium sp. 018/SC-01/001 TaxID=2592069 RepID=UPI0011815A69|nr:HAMP domain-containing sensor histidine kinase [Mycolicibacterium sp. 018/SC-01/001]TRW78486.1 HAMP domain-containing histidine kinase [Mycolicibacterium sp. 018/SC-01/001]